MGLGDQLTRAVFEKRGMLENPNVNLVRAMTEEVDSLAGGDPTLAGVRISPENALQSTAVYACTRLIANAVASLPLRFYTGQGEKRREVVGDDRQRMLRKQGRVNDMQTGFEFWETITAHLLLRGNAYGAKVVNPLTGKLSDVIPLMPNRVKPIRLPAKSGGGIGYRVDAEHGGPMVLNADEVIHFKNLSLNGLEGVSPIAACRLALGLGRAAEEYGARFYSNDARPGGVLQVPGKLSDQSYKRLRARWERMHLGARRAHMMAILEEGAEWKDVGIAPQDAQFIATRKFQIQEVSRIFGVPPHMIGDIDKSTSWGTGIQQQSLGFVMFVLEPWLERIEARLVRSLLDTDADAKDDVYAEFSVEGLLRGDTMSRYQAYALARQWSIMTINEIRAEENLPPVEGGDVLFTPTNMAPLAAAAQGQADQMDALHGKLDSITKQLGQTAPQDQAPTDDGTAN